MKYKTRKEAEKIASFENMGRDYGTAIVEKVGEFYIVKIV